MPDQAKFKLWCVSEGDMIDLNPVKVRDLIIECFFAAQKETFRCVKQKKGRPSQDEDLHKTVVAMVRLGFRDTGEDFENPTKEGLQEVVMYLADKAGSWGTPEDIINHHKSQIQRVLGCL